MTWGRFLTTFCFATVLIGTALLGFVVIVDPYDTGRFTPLRAYGLPENSPRLVTASVARNPALDGAIIGNSTIQMLAPRRLAALTGEKLAQLSNPGVGPVEELAILNWFRREHGTPKVIVVGLDYSSWCGRGFVFSRADILNPFPFWLYGSDAEYLAKVLSFRSVGDSASRINMWLGNKPPVDPMRVDDYDIGRTFDITAVRTRLARAEQIAEHVEAPVTHRDDGAPPGAALEFLRANLEHFPPTTRKILILTPTYAGTLPTAGEWAENITTCKQRAKAIAAALPNTTLLDFLRKSPMTDNDTNFWDGIHYRRPVAEAIERVIAATLAGHDPQHDVDAALDDKPVN